MTIGQAKTPQEQLKDIKAKADRYNAGAIRLNAEIENAQENTKRLSEQAMAEFQTSDLQELEAMLAELTRKNEAILIKGHTETEEALQRLQEKQEAINKAKNGV